MPSFHFVPHTADIAVELSAADAAGLRAAGVAALRQLLVGTSVVERRQQRAIALRGTDDATRLVHFLQDVLYLFATEHFVPAAASEAGIVGEPFDPARHEPQPEVKAVTFHDARVRRAPGGSLHSVVVFDV